MPLPHDYVERVYAGVLGKVIGVYLGRPFEGWTYERIMAELGEIRGYVHDRLGVPLIVTDDDISGTFTFLRALTDYGCDLGLTPGQIGQSWLNYIIENRTILWWGGLGVSTEHTAYLRLKRGLPAPFSGSAVTNGKVVSEQIGAQIFIDGWAMVAPGDPERAADLARRAASVSHDGEAVYGAQVIAAMESAAFVEPSIQRLLDTGLSVIPQDSTIARLIHDLREWHAAEPDWRRTRERVAAVYGYERYGGGCHMVPNHALIILSLLYGDGDFDRSLSIVNTCGWDTDCNSANVGCLLGIRGGLEGIGARWRQPVADRLYLPTADGGGAISDAVAETYHIVNAGRGLAGLKPLVPKSGARFHFSLPGSVQGFVSNDAAVANDGGRLVVTPNDHAFSVAAATFMPADHLPYNGAYTTMASPTLHPGQTVRASVAALTRPAACRLFIRSYDETDAVAKTSGPIVALAPGESGELSWTIPDLGGAPVVAVGIEGEGTVWLEWLTWDGTPDVELRPSPKGGLAWKRAWVDGLDRFDRLGDRWRLVQNAGTGLAIQGTREWTDYRVEADVSIHMAQSAGIGVRVQGMARYYALLLCAGGTVRLVKALDGVKTLAEAPFAWAPDQAYRLGLEASGPKLTAYINGQAVLAAVDHGLTGGAAAMLVEEGHALCGPVRVLR